MARPVFKTKLPNIACAKNGVSVVFPIVFYPFLWPTEKVAMYKTFLFSQKSRVDFSRCFMKGDGGNL